VLKFNLIVYVLFILSGVIKSFMFVKFLPVDLTLITAVYCVAVIFYNVTTSKKIYIPGIKVPLVILVVFYAWLTFSLMHTPSTNYALQKYLLSYLNLIAFCYPVFCKFCFKTFTKSIVVISLILLVLFMIFRLTFSYEFMTDNNLKSIYLAFGVLLGFALIFLRTIDHRFQFGIFLILLSGLLISSARGPLIFYIFSILAVKLFGLKSNRNAKKIFKISYILIPTFILILIITNSSVLQSVMGLLQNTIIRFSAFLSTDGGESVNTRLELYYQAIDMFSENILLGNGLGSFGLYVTGTDMKLYPHNIVLELLSETGVVSILILLIFILSLSKKIINNDIIFMISLYAFMNVMKSNSFEELRMFFGFLAVGLLYAREIENTSIKKFHKLFSLTTGK
jgi:O-antigen ligase